MENLIVYIAKACGLTLMFYASYYLLLRKETFFRANRWFLLAGMATATLLPLVVVTKVVWITPQPLPSINLAQLSNVTMMQQAPIAPQEPFEVNWWYVAAAAYAIGSAFLLGRLVFDFKKVFSLFKGQNVIRQGNYRFIDSKAAKSPFSFFNYIIFNSAVLEPGELVGILSHEKVHSRQKHSVDMIAAQVFCAAFWFNPIAWLYKKAIAQNLEFIADSEAIKHVDDVTAYQKTLLKITLQPVNISITNHFYQSLIKKRIVMLNKPKSKKQNSLKYIVVVPALAAFMAFFQVEIIAQERPDTGTSQTSGDESDSVIITKYLSDDGLTHHSDYLSKTYGIKVTFSDITRNEEGYITAIKAEVTGGMGKNVVNRQYAVKGKQPIQSFMLTVSKKGNETDAEFTSEPLWSKDKVVLGSYNETTAPKAPEGYEDALTVIDGIKQPKGALANVNAENIESINVFKNATDKYGDEGKNGVIEITTKKEKAPVVVVNGDFGDASTDMLFVVDGVKQPKDAIKKLNPQYIKSITVLKNQEAVDKYGEDGKKGVIEISYETSADRYDTGLSPSELAKQNGSKSTVRTISYYTTTNGGTSDKITANSIKITGEGNKEISGDKLNIFLMDNGNSAYVIDKKSTDADLDLYVKALLKEGIECKYSGIKRNSNGEIVKIKIELKDKEKNKAAGTFENNKGISAIYVGKKSNMLIVQGQ